MLARYGVATALRLKIESNSNYFNFNLYVDGRIRANPSEKLDDMLERARYAKEVHLIVQSCFVQYNKLLASGKWDSIKAAHRTQLMAEVKDEL